MSDIAIHQSPDQAIQPPKRRRRRGRSVEAGVSIGFLVFLGMLGATWWLMLQLVPAELSLTLLGRSIGPVGMHEHITSAALLALLVSSAFWIEAEMVGWSKSSARQLIVSLPATVKTDIACFLLSHARVYEGLAKLMTLGASLLSGVWLRDWVQATTGFAIAPLAAPLPLQVAFYFVIFTFFEYWAHRADHNRFLWPLHRYHHSATDFAVLTSIRVHPAAFSSIFLVNIPMAMLGTPIEALIWVVLLADGIGFLIHSKIDADWGWIGRWVIQSPNNHRMHHKFDMSHPTGHFGRMPIWDRLFGTYYREGSGSVVIGVDTPYDHGFLAPRDMVRDYGDFWTGLFDGLAGKPSPYVYDYADPEPDPAKPTASLHHIHDAKGRAA